MVSSQSSFKNLGYFDLLTLRRQTPISVLCNSVAKPKGAELKHGLPYWNYSPLDAKLSMVPYPKGTTAFTRGKIGHKLWQRSEISDFNVSDPYGHSVKIEYDSVHDEHLKRWFKNSNNRKPLKELGIVTDNLDVICTLKQYNAYRAYLMVLHRDAMKNELMKKEYQMSEAKKMRDMLHVIMHEMEKLERKEDRDEIKMEYQMKLHEEREQKKARCAKRLQRVDERVAYREKTKYEELMKRKERCRAIDQKLRDRNRVAADIERKRKIQTFRRWHDNDVEKKRKDAEQNKINEETKENNLATFWQMKIDAQNKQIAKNEMLLFNHQIWENCLVQKRNRRVQAHRTKLDEELERVKAKRKTEKIQERRTKKHEKEVIKALTAVWSDHKEAEGVQDLDKKRIDKEIKNALANILLGMDPYIVLAEAKNKLQQNVPEPVSNVIKEMLNRVIKKSISQRVERVVQDLENKAKGLCHRFHTDKLKHRHPSFLIHSAKQSEQIMDTPDHTEDKKQLKLHGQKPLESLVSSRRISFVSPEGPISVEVLETGKTLIQAAKVLDEKKHCNKNSQSPKPMNPPQIIQKFGSRSISFGQITIGLRELTDLKSVKDRPPTPVPSLTDLAKAVFADPFIKDESVLVEVERNKTLKAIEGISKILQKIIEPKVSQMIAHKLSPETPVGMKPTNLIPTNNEMISKLTHMVLNTEDYNNTQNYSQLANIADSVAVRVINVFNKGIVHK